MNALVPKPSLTPFSLKDAPSLIERVWPAQKISVETQKERKANLGQTLTGLGSYWKGRKPLVLVRACVIGLLLPATDDTAKDLEIFELLMGLADEQIPVRFKEQLTVEEVQAFGSTTEIAALLEVKDDAPRLKKMNKEIRTEVMSGILARMPYQSRVEKLLRPEEVANELLVGPVMAAVNSHLGTTAKSLPELIEQLGVARFGHRPKLADTFCGGGSIPFEAARIGCDVYASDLNPIACMLTWGALNVVGANSKRRLEIEKARSEVAKSVDAQITRLGIEHDSDGNRAKAYLYCLETRCLQTGWMVPMLPTFVVSKQQNVIVVLVPDHAKKRFDIEVRSGVSDKVLKSAVQGTVSEGRLSYQLDGESYSTPIKTIRGDRKAANGETVNSLRRWEKSDFIPRSDDIFQERLYCVQWIKKSSIGKGRPETFFAKVTADDLLRERKVEKTVEKQLTELQAAGIIPDMEIEEGVETGRLLRERGWTYWHQLFNARQLLLLSLYFQHRTEEEFIFSAKTLDWNSRLSNWMNHWDKTNNVFYNQALNTLFNYGIRCFESHEAGRSFGFASADVAGRTISIDSIPADKITENVDIYVTDPPYADAVNYHEITEFFIAWLRKNPPEQFSKWTWDSRRPLAIKGDGAEFKSRMVASYRNMADHMPDNGLQIVMFTHQDAGVWGDMAQIFWGAGLQVMAAWYIATETNTELKKGGYVQGTVILVLRKRKDGEYGYKDEIVQEVKVEVADQIDTMSGLNQSLKGHGRIENLFEDADLQMAGYAAALRVLTKYTTIDGVDMTKEALKPAKKGEVGLVADIIEFAVQVANEHMVPEGMPPKVWGNLTGSERFFFKMVDVEETGAKKLDNYQNFSRAFRVPKYDDLMGSLEPNKARLKSAKEFKKSGFEGSEFGGSKSRALLFAIYEIQNDVDGDDVLSHLRDMVPDYFNVRDDLASLADYIAKKRANIDEPESRAAGILHGLIRNERFG